MMNNAKTIINDINNRLYNLGGKRYYSEFYIGITKDIQTRLFGNHNIKKDDWYLCYKAINEEHARYVESHFLDKGMKGGNGGGLGDGSAIYVYCYYINDHTRQ